MTQEFSIFKGDTFIASGLYRTSAGVPIDLAASGITIEAYVKTKDGTKFPLTVSFGAVGSYTLTAPTDDWPLGRNLMVIRYTVGTVRRTADPVVVNVEQA